MKPFPTEDHLGLLSSKSESEPEPSNGDGFSIRPGSPLAGVKGGVPENLLAAIRQIVRDEIRAGLQEAQTQRTWIQKLRRFFT